MALKHQHEDKILLVLTLLIGAAVGLVVVAFILLTENLGARLYPAGGAAWRRVLIPIAGALGTGFLLFRYFPQARGSGIPQTKAALFLGDGYISFRTVLGKFSLCSVSLASGIALGREGPSVHVGAGIASTLGRKLGLSTAGVKALVPAGASAAIAAAFNTPISAVLFSLEEVMGDMNAPVLGSVVLSSATSWIVLHLLLGDEPLFHVPAYQLVHPSEFLWYAALGVVGGLVSTAFVKLLLWQRKYFLKAPRSTQWFMPAVGGVTVGLLGWFFPDVLGVGYAVVGRALNGQMVVGAMAAMVLLKVIATATCYSSGNAGGIFGPSLFIGAMMGGAVGGVVHTLMPDYTGSVGVYALVGMGAAFAGIVRVPLTSVIMVFEITRDYSIIVPLMIANLISYFLASRLQEEPIYEALQHQDGIRLPTGARARGEMLLVGHGYRPEAQVLSASETIRQAAGSVDRDRGAYPVTGPSGFRGMVTLAQLEEALAAGRGDAPLAQLVPEADPAGEPHVYADDPLDAAMRLLAGGKRKVLPVVSRTNIRDLKGTISLQDILGAYALGTAGDEAQEAPQLPKRVIAGVAAALAGAVLLAAFLNYYYRAEQVRRAARFRREGAELLQKDRLPEAITQFRNALSISHRMDDRLNLGLALARAGRLSEASTYLERVLSEQPGSGPANLALAKIEAQEGRTADAGAHARRAISGSWPRDAEQNRARARMELFGILKNAGKRAQAKAELLALAADPPADRTLKKQIGDWLLELGLPAEAAGLFRELGDSAGLGEADLALGNYKEAAQAFRAAGDTSRAGLCERILALDPTQRGIGSSERLRRSQEILAAVQACAGRPRSIQRSSDANLAAAEDLWPLCAQPDEALQHVMSKPSAR